MSGFHYTEFSKTGSILLNAEEKDELFGYIDRLKKENADLRELVAYMWRELAMACAEQVVSHEALRKVSDRMRELGVEVDA